ncbi:MAG: S8 family serine peptidase [Rhodothermaceae bacterium]|nr:S8 family serine peptidase [Rhodothermaceae bacterium]MYH11712.1 S8 family serine peptidase [Rhodothermaceae bacterium]MYJ49426.1 S8 family serine peptidase [Rhodothermaceae bacterium]
MMRFPKSLHLSKPLPRAGRSAERLDRVTTRVFRAILILVITSLRTAPMLTAQVAPEHEPNVIVVQFSPEVSFANKSSSTGLQTFDRMAATLGVHTIERVYLFLDHVVPTPKTRRNLMALRRTYYVRYHADAAPRLVAKQLDGVPGVVYAEPVLVNHTSALTTREHADPDDPRFGGQTHLRHMYLPEAWEVVKGENRSPRVVIAIVDTGGEWRHEDLVGNVWTNSDEIPDNGEDDDNNGFIDDVHGVDFNDHDDNDPTPPSLDNYHGTASAGSASAVTDNGVGIAGPAWNAEIMHISGYSYEGILYAAVNGADIINASWVSGRSGTYQSLFRLPDQTLNLATDMGALVVAAADNQGRNNDVHPIRPAGHPRVLSVGATEKDSRVKADFSNYGKLVNVFAPGVSIPSTYRNNGYDLYGGTSAASPLTAGVAALVKTRFPEMTPDAVREHVRLTSENIDAENPGLAGQLGRGYVNALAAVQEPTLPAVRLKRWSWTDSDRNRKIASGDRVTITATMVNYLIDARQLSVGLVGAEPYAFLDMTLAESYVGSLASGDSVIVRFEFAVTTNAPANQWVRLYTRVREGAHADGPDMISLRINYELDSVYESLSALYRATGGDNWNDNDKWDFTIMPTEDELYRWHGVDLFNGFLIWLFLSYNNLTGEIPAQLGNLLHLQMLNLSNNSLSGEIPSELGDLSQLQRLNLSRNTLTGPIPPELGDLSQLRRLEMHENALTGVLPRSLLQLDKLETFYFGGQDLCAPKDNEFQAWLSSIRYVDGPTCTALQFADGIADHTFTEGAAIVEIVLPEASGGQLPYVYTLEPALPAGLIFEDSSRTISGVPAEGAAAVLYTYSAVDNGGASVSLTFTLAVAAAVSFEDAVANQSYPRTHPIAPLALPEAVGGVPPIGYALTPKLPAGISYDASTRTISGTPRQVTAAPVPYTYKAIDTNGSADSLHFNIEVYSPVAVEREVLPEMFAVRGNYPNPFRQSTRLVFDLPWSARVTVEVMDVAGRRVLTVPAESLPAGWRRGIEISGRALPSGLYLYRLIVTSPESTSTHAGRLLRIR